MSYGLLTRAALLALLPTPGARGCLYGARPAYTFTGISFEREPENGKLVKTGANRFIYTPDKAFIGKDAYIFKICASKGAQKGCSTVAFVSQVK